MKKTMACCFSVSLLLSGGPNEAASAPAQYASSINQSTYQIPVNSSRLFNLNQGETVISAPEPNIAFIEQLKGDVHRLLIRGMKPGSTSIVLMNKDNRLSRTLNLEITLNLDALKKKLYQLLPDENIKVLNAEGKIILSGQVSNMINMDAAMRIAQAYAPTGNSPASSPAGSSSTGSSPSGSSSGSVINMMQIGGGQQVMLEVKIAEVSRTLARKLSISRSVQNNAANANANDFIWSALSAAAGVFTGSYLTGQILFSWTIDFSKETGLATLLAEPNLTTLSGQKASFLAGGEFPYQNCSNATADGTGATGGVICNVAFKQYGVGLEFLPTVLDSNKINLSTHVSVSTLSNITAQVTGVASATPSLLTREAQTTIELADGQSMSIAGLLSNEATGNQTQIPGLADLPLIGSLFRNRGNTSDQKELIILVTPHLAKPLAKEQTRLPTDAFVEPDDVDFYLLGKTESRKIQHLPPEYSPTNNVTTGGVNGQFGQQINEGGVP